MTRNMRKKPRKAMRNEAWVRTPDGFSTRKCVISDISESGVQLQLEAPQFLRDQFLLLMSGAGGPARACRVKWRRGTRIGAEFVTAA